MRQAQRGRVYVASSKTFPFAAEIAYSVTTRHAKQLWNAEYWVPCKVAAQALGCEGTIYQLTHFNSVGQTHWLSESFQLGHVGVWSSQPFATKQLHEPMDRPSVFVCGVPTLGCGQVIAFPKAGTPTKATHGIQGSSASKFCPVSMCTNEGCNACGTNLPTGLRQPKSTETKATATGDRV